MRIHQIVHGKVGFKDKFMVGACLKPMHSSFLIGMVNELFLNILCLSRNDHECQSKCYMHTLYSTLIQSHDTAWAQGILK